jgi:hypothetical protein
MPEKTDHGALQVVARTDIPAVDWDAVVSDSPDGWVFALFGWQQLILAVEQWGLEDFSFGLRENGKLLAVIPLQLNRHSGRISSSGWGGSGPVLHPALVGKNRHRVMKAALYQCVARGRDCGATHFDFSASPVTRSAVTSAWGVNPFIAYGFEDQAGLSQVVDLAPPEETLWAGLSADARRQVRIAREHGYTVERADWDACLDHYYALHCETYRRTGVPPHPREYFAGLASCTAPTGHSVLWLARSPGGEVIAYHNAAWFGAGGYYHTGCSAAEASESGASYLLFWEALLGAKAAGIRWYDCGAIFPTAKDPKQRGLTTFKTKFGGEAHRLFRVEMQLQQAAESAVPARSPRSSPQALFASRVVRVLVRGARRLTAPRNSGEASES